MFQGANTLECESSRQRKFPGQVAPGNESSRERKGQGAKRPGSERARERKFRAANWPESYWPIRSRERIGPGAKRLWIVRVRVKDWCENELHPFFFVTLFVNCSNICRFCNFFNLIIGKNSFLRLMSCQLHQQVNIVQKKIHIHQTEVISKQHCKARLMMENWNNFFVKYVSKPASVLQRFYLSHQRRHSKHEHGQA